MILAAKSRPRKTVEDFMRLPDGTRAELIDGELFMRPSPFERHQRFADNLQFQLTAFVRSRKLGRVYSAPLDIHLPSGDIVEPDLFFVANSNRSIAQDWIRARPDLVIEVLSLYGMERDRIVKRDLYARNGVGQYWIVDPEEESIEVFVLRERQYGAAGYFLRSDILTSPSLPQFRLPLSDVFEEPFEPQPS